MISFIVFSGCIIYGIIWPIILGVHLTNCARNKSHGLPVAGDGALTGLLFFSIIIHLVIYGRALGAW